MTSPAGELGDGRKDGVTRTARAFFHALGITDWMLLLLMFIAVINAPTPVQFYMRFKMPLPTDQKEYAWFNYWTLITFSMVYASLFLYWLYLMNYRQKLLSIPLAVIHGMTAAFSGVCLLKLSFEKLLHLEDALHSDFFQRLTTALVSSFAILMFLLVRLTREMQSQSPGTPVGQSAVSSAQQVSSTHIPQALQLGGVADPEDINLRSRSHTFPGAGA